MTREEAIEICRRNGNSSSKPWYEIDVDNLVELGLLKLNPPAPSPEQIFSDAWRNCVSAHVVLEILAANGFKLVRDNK